MEGSSCIGISPTYGLPVVLLCRSQAAREGSTTTVHAPRQEMKRPSGNIGIAARGETGSKAANGLNGSVVDNADGCGGGATLEEPGLQGPDVAQADSGATAEAKELMPFKRQKTRSGGRALQRQKTAAMEDYLQTLPEAEAKPSKALQVNAENIAVNLRVTRGPDWSWGEEDGGKSGVILSFDKATGLAQVLWEGGQAHKHYRFGHDKNDLMICTNSETSPLGRRNSQLFFSSKSQTLLIFDWDDTLFPTTYVRDDLKLVWNKPLKDQDLSPAEKATISKKLDLCATHVVELLKGADRVGKVVLLTLARAPWVSESCKNFFSSVGRLIKQLQIPIIYAQEGIMVDYSKEKMSSDEEIERFWSSVKGKAIARECNKFYSQYEGQSWKNVISIGDSDFERLGTQHAMENYMREQGIDGDGKLVDINGHLYKVRTKTFKMLDEPTVEELTVEVDMLKAWLPLMVTLDSSFDVNLNNADDPQVLRAIDKTLRGQ